MSIQYACDGCQKPVVTPIEKGHVLKRQYCEICAAVADTFLAGEQELRKSLYEQFKKGRDELIALLSKDGIKLPDVL